MSKTHSKQEKFYILIIDLKDKEAAHDKIYNKVHIFFVKDDCIIKKKDTKQKDIETINSILQDTEPEKVALVKRFVLGYLG